MPLGLGSLEGFKSTLVDLDVVQFRKFRKIWNEMNFRCVGTSKAEASSLDKYPGVGNSEKWFFGKPIEQAEPFCDDAVRQ